ncbi:peptidylprolyl isomerase [Paenibacillus sp. FSL H8-0537]|uniref:peptidylprolyl isomerase n=1 Tax=Paenibacillus sp. FSL H8-0537 TaxID=2921399 RepID=UPI0031015174
MSRKQWTVCSAFLMALLIMTLLAGCGAKGSLTSQGAAAESGNAEKVMRWERMPEMELDLNKSYTAVFTTNKGNFTVKLYANEAPITVNNFVFLARHGFYDGLTFHRIIESFMIQGGDPQGNGVGTPGYSIPDELDTEIKYEPGIVAMANAGKPNTGGSQFFICTGSGSENLNQNPNYSIFGKVISGMDTVADIAKTPVDNNEPLEDIIIQNIVIEEK